MLYLGIMRRIKSLKPSTIGHVFLLLTIIYSEIVCSASLLPSYLAKTVNEQVSTSDTRFSGNPNKSHVNDFESSIIKNVEQHYKKYAFKNPRRSQMKPLLKVDKKTLSVESTKDKTLSINERQTSKNSTLRSQQRGNTSFVNRSSTLEPLFGNSTEPENPANFSSCIQESLAERTLCYIENILISLEFYLKTTRIGVYAFLSFCGVVLFFILLIICFRICAKKTKRSPPRKPKWLKDDEIDMEAEGPCKFGKLQVSFDFSVSKQELKVGIVQAANLPDVQSMDPYVRLTYEAKNENKKSKKEKPKRYTTKTIKNTLNPVFNETFKFKIPMLELSSKKFIFELFDENDIGHDTLVGKVKLQLKDNEIQSCQGRALEKWIALVGGKDLFEGPGDLLVILRNQTGMTSNKIMVTLTEGKNLQVHGSKMTKLTSYFCELHLYVNKKSKGSKKTSTRKGIKSVYFNENFYFNLDSSNDIHYSVIKILVYNVKHGIKRCMGSIYLGKDVNSEPAQKHWEEIIKFPKKPCPMWHSIKKGTEDVAA